jgi:hypothetical protein
MGFALWIDERSGIAWAQGTHEYRPMGSAAIARTSQFRRGDFRPARQCPATLKCCFQGFYGSLEEVNVTLRSKARPRSRAAPAHLL